MLLLGLLAPGLLPGFGLALRGALLACPALCGLPACSLLPVRLCTPRILAIVAAFGLALLLAVVARLVLLLPVVLCVFAALVVARRRRRSDTDGQDAGKRERAQDPGEGRVHVVYLHHIANAALAPDSTFARGR